MPTYDYACSACGKEFEVFQSIKDQPLKTCKVCGKTGTVRRKIGTGAGVIFKGSGFYETDYKRNSSSSAGKSESSGSSSTPSSSPAPAS